MSPEEIAWVAGIIEGEGTFVAHGSGVRIGVAMTDIDIINRLAAVTGIGNVYHNLSVARPHHKPASLWCVGRRAHAVHLFAAIYPWLGRRRRERIDALLARWENTTAGG